MDEIAFVYTPDTPPWARHLIRKIGRLEALMTDFVQAEADAEAEITTLLAELVAAVKAASHVDPGVQAAADKLEAFLGATKVADPTPAPVQAPASVDAPAVEPASVPDAPAEPTPPTV